MTLDREEALRLAQELLTGNPPPSYSAYALEDIFALALLALAADLEAAERKSEAREVMARKGQEWKARAETAERERDDLKERVAHLLRTAASLRLSHGVAPSEEYREACLSVGELLYPDSTPAKIDNRLRKAERDLATAREALEDIGNMRFSDTRADMRACQEIARAALRSLEEK